MRRNVRRVVGIAFLLMMGALGSGLAADTARPVEDGYVVFNFDGIEIGAFVKIVAEMTNRRFLVGPEVQGKITVVSPSRLRRDEVAGVFSSILQSRGYAIVEENGISHVVATGTRGVPAAPVIGDGETAPEHGVYTRVIRLQHVSAAEMRAVLENRMGSAKQGGIVAAEELNCLVLTDAAESIRRAEQLVAALDRPGMVRVTRVVALQHVSAEELAGQLEQALAETENRAERLKRRLAQPGTPAVSTGRGPAVIPAPHSNSLILVGAQSQIDELAGIIAQMDVDVPARRGRMNAIFLRYLQAEEAAKSLNALLEKTMGKVETLAPEKRIAIEPSQANNALLVNASPADLETVKSLVAQLDVCPEQVHIEVVIAEVKTSDGMKLGVELGAVEAPGLGETTVQGLSTMKDADDNLLAAIGKGVLPGGISVGLAFGGASGVSYPGLINIDALRSKGLLDILSRTSLEAQNNREAQVNIVDEIPVLKSTIEGGSGTARDVIQNIERVDVGIKVALTPHIVSGDEVQMELSPSIEAVTDTGAEGTSLTPTISKRSVSTTVTVSNNQTIVIAGLTREDKIQRVNKVPILGYIPLIGWMFTQHDEVKEKTDLLIFVTPRIAGEPVDREKVLADWRESTGAPVAEPQRPAP